MSYLLPETALVEVKEVERDGFYAKFDIEPLAPGYGVTLANSLRRVLLASLPGAAITSVRIEGATHEFSTVPGVEEDVVEIILNLKNLNFKLNSDEPIILTLDKKGPGVVTAADFKKHADVEIMNPSLHIATLDKKGHLSLEVSCEKGRGYVTVEMRRAEKQPLGSIAIDSIFTPTKKVHYTVENTRVDQMTNFDKISLEITTDGTVDPYDALKQASQILIDHFSILAGLAINTSAEEPVLTETEMIDENEIVEAKPKRRSRKVAEVTE